MNAEEQKQEEQMPKNKKLNIRTSGEEQKLNAQEKIHKIYSSRTVRRTLE